MKHQLYLKCQYCHIYFEYNGGRRSSVCSPRCKVAKWRKGKDPKKWQTIEEIKSQNYPVTEVESRISDFSVGHERNKRKEQ